MKRAAIVMAVLAMVLAIGIIAYSASTSAQHGKEVYTAQKCQMCHSIAGVGNKKYPLDDVATKMKADDIKKFLKDPKAIKPDVMMKSYANLPAQDLDDMVAYLLSLKK